MTAFLTALAAIVLLVLGMVWLVLRAQATAMDEIRRETERRKQDYEKAARSAEIVAENRSAGDTAKRMRDGSF